MKKGIEYHRFSKDKQSNFSIERQEIVTSAWIRSNNIQLIDSFKDDGYSARNFDRPDVKKLFDFIKKNHKDVDYLIVAELSRFSRELGDAVNMVTKIQKDFGVHIVSAGGNHICDIYDHSSFTRMSLEFMLSNADNIKRMSDIQGGIYTGKMKGNFISPKAPFGYQKKRDGLRYELVIDEPKAAAIRFIFQSFLQEVPMVEIHKRAKLAGFTNTSKMAIQDVLNNPVYAAHQMVKPWKKEPGGMKKGNWPPIISMGTWQQVQDKMRKPAKERVALNDAMPLRGVLRCHCGKLLTAAPSRSRNGSYYVYYKCNHSKHNNFSAVKAHNQLDETLKLLSIPERLIGPIRQRCEQLMEEEMKVAKMRNIQQKHKLAETVAKLHSVEEKFIMNQLSLESYQTWHQQLLQERNMLASHIEKFNKQEGRISLLLQQNLHHLSDLSYTYNRFDTPGKQDLIRKVFDNQLYYQDKVYRTTYILPFLNVKPLLLKEKKLLVIEEKSRIREVSCLSGVQQGSIEPLADFLDLIRTLSIRVA